MKLLVILILSIVALPTTQCNNNNLIGNQFPEDSFTGCWYISPNEGESYIFKFYKDEQGNLTGENHSYLNKAKFPMMPIEIVEITGNEIRFVANNEADISYEGELSEDGNTIDGALLFANGERMEFPLKRMTDEQLAEEFPGINNSIPQPYIYREPQSEISEFGFDTSGESVVRTDLLEQMTNEILEGKWGTIHSVIIAAGNRLIYEEYFNGFWEDDLQSQQSATKSIASLLIGAALQQGYEIATDTPIMEYFPEYEDDVSEGWEHISLHDILSMRAGLDWKDMAEEKVSYKSDDLFSYIFHKNPIHTAGTVFRYSSPNVNLVAGVIKSITGSHADTFADTYIFKPLGITSFDWRFDKFNGGYPRMDGTLALRPRDMIKIGLLMLHRGTCNGKRIISEDWYEKMTTPYSKVDDGMSYGYYWWLPESRSLPGVQCILASGLGSEFILIVPELDLVAVTTGGNFDFDKMQLPLMMLDKYVLPAVME